VILILGIIIIGGLCGLSTIILEKILGRALLISILLIVGLVSYYKGSWILYASMFMLIVAGFSSLLDKFGRAKIMRDAQYILAVQKAVQEQSR
jgi:uncharacterized protein (DUF58 family)